MGLWVALAVSVWAQPLEHRGIWLHPEQFRTPQECKRFVLRQIELCRQAGARGVNFFALAYLSDEILPALSSGPFSTPARAYVPLGGTQ